MGGVVVGVVGVVLAIFGSISANGGQPELNLEVCQCQQNRFTLGAAYGMGIRSPTILPVGRAHP